MVLVVLLATALADDKTHQYQPNEEVTVWMNRVGPYHNPQETYDYYSLPICRPAVKQMRHKSDSLGVVLEGSDLTDSGLPLHFQTPQTMTKICDVEITDETAKVLTEAVKNHYWYQMYIDELPVWGMVGEYMKGKTAEHDKVAEMGFIYAHREFSISYNADQIIEVNLTSENPQPLTVGSTIALTLSATWQQTDKPFANRFDRYLDFDFFEHQIHWFSIFNSFMMVIFLCGLVALILMRTLKNDYTKFAAEEDRLDLEQVVDETGWKLVHGDVFRAPPQLLLLSAIVGTGSQLLAMGGLIIIITILGSFYHQRGSIVTTALTTYALTSTVAGFSSASLYKKYNGYNWKSCMVATALFFPVVCSVVSAFLNMIALAYGSLAAIDFFSNVQMLSIWFCGSCPLLFIGTILGRSMTSVGGFPCKVTTTQRPIPDPKWYLRAEYLCAASGILPFGSIFIEMYFVFTSFWNYKFYYVYGFMLLVYVILIIVTMCVTVVLTYFLLNSENHKWHWPATIAAGSTAGYVYLYAIYYFFNKTNMSGLLQTFFYFGYMGLFSFSLFLLCGTIGYFASSSFVHRIYNIKAD